MGRRCKLDDPHVVETILNSMAAGAYLSDAAEYAGVHRDTVYRWMAAGEKQTSGKFRRFYDAIRQAEAKAKMRAVATLSSAMAGDWRASLAFLERRDPAHWGPRVRVTLEQEFDAAIKQLEAALPPEWFDVALRAIAGEPGTAPLDGAPTDEG